MSFQTHRTLVDWQHAYATGAAPESLLVELLDSIDDCDPAWISVIKPAQLEARLRTLAQQKQAVGLSALPLYGVPVAVKDNIDVAGLATTCACPAFSYLPTVSASAVLRLEAAGAVIVGKTNLDQFATGLVGTRSPYGVVPNTFKPEFIAGGSSSGSASVVARGIVPIALATDTAGSGRVPAGHNNLVGLKPTRGHVSTAGLVPACRSLDCITVLSLTVEDADLTLQIMGGFDSADSYSRHKPPRAAALPAFPVFGVPSAPQWFGDTAAQLRYESALRALESQGVRIKPVDFTPLFEVAELLYTGPWVAERYAAIEAWMENDEEAVHPVVRKIIAGASGKTAVDTFKAEYRRMALARVAERLMADLDGLLVPTAPTIYTIEEVLADPVRLNSHMGLYTNFVNLLDWCALALPNGLRAEGDKRGLPCGFTAIMPAWHESRLIEFGKRWQTSVPWLLGNSVRQIPENRPSSVLDMRGDMLLAVVGAHLSGMPLNHQLLERGAVLVEKTCTSADYRLYALADTTPAKPGLLRSHEGACIEVEIWAMPTERVGSFLSLVPAPLSIGTLTLVDGRRVKGFLCEGLATCSAQDITSSGGWKNHMARGRP